MDRVNEGSRIPFRGSSHADPARKPLLGTSTSVEALLDPIARGSAAPALAAARVTAEPTTRPITAHYTAWLRNFDPLQNCSLTDSLARYLTTTERVLYPPPGDSQRATSPLSVPTEAADLPSLPQVPNYADYNPFSFTESLANRLKSEASVEIERKRRYQEVIKTAFVELDKAVLQIYIIEAAKTAYETSLINSTLGPAEYAEAREKTQASALRMLGETIPEFLKAHCGDTLAYIEALYGKLSERSKADPAKFLGQVATTLDSLRKPTDAELNAFLTAHGFSEASTHNFTDFKAYLKQHLYLGDNTPGANETVFCELAYKYLKGKYPGIKASSAPTTMSGQKFDRMRKDRYDWALSEDLLIQQGLATDHDSLKTNEIVHDFARFLSQESRIRTCAPEGTLISVWTYNQYMITFLASHAESNIAYAERLGGLKIPNNKSLDFFALVKMRDEKPVAPATTPATPTPAAATEPPVVKKAQSTSLIGTLLQGCTASSGTTVGTTHKKKPVLTCTVGSGATITTHKKK